MEGLGRGRRKEHGEVFQDGFGGSRVDVAGSEDGVVPPGRLEDEVGQQQEHRVADQGIAYPQVAETKDRHPAGAADETVRAKAGAVVRQETPAALTREVREVAEQRPGVRGRIGVDEQGEIRQSLLGFAERERIGNAAAERAGMVTSVTLQGRQLLRWHCCCKYQCRSQRGKDMSRRKMHALSRKICKSKTIICYFCNSFVRK